MANFVKYNLIIITILLMTTACTKQVEERLPIKQYDDIIYVYDQADSNNFTGSIYANDFLKNDFIGFGELYDNNPVFITPGNTVVIAHDLSTMTVSKNEKIKNATIKYFQMDKDFKLSNSELLGFIRSIKSHGKRNSNFITVYADASFSSITVSFPSPGRLERLSRHDYASDQPQRMFENMKGYIIGFIFPDKYTLLNRGKNNLYFVSEDFKYAGRIENFNASYINVKMDFSNSVNIEL